MLHNAGHRQCRFVALDLTADEPVPGAPFDLVYARLLLFHLPGRVSVLRRLWDAVAAGGHLLIHEYDPRSIGVPDRQALWPLLIGAWKRRPDWSACTGSVRRSVQIPKTMRGSGAYRPHDNTQTV